MHSRSNAWNEAFAPRSWVARLSFGWKMSLAGHVALSAAFAAMTILAQRPKKEDVSITVYQTASAVPAALSVSKPKPQPKKRQPLKPRGVFGVSRNAITSEAPSAIEIKAGNTVAKAPDQEALKPGDADSLPVPTDEILVSRMPELMEEVRIPYPAEAKRKGVQGPVVMDLLIDDQGKVRDALLVSGPGSGLDEAALTAVRAFRFKPALMEDRAVAVRIRYAYRFVLEQ